MSERLFEAISAGDIDGVRAALAAGASVEALSPGGRKPIFNAVGHEHVEIIKLLITAGASPTDGLVAALMRSSFPLAKLLLEAGADVHAQLTDSGQTILHAACDCRMAELVRYLVTSTDVDVDAKMTDGRTARELANELGLDADALFAAR